MKECCSSSSSCDFDVISVKSLSIKFTVSMLLNVTSAGAIDLPNLSGSFEYFGCVSAITSILGKYMASSSFDRILIFLIGASGFPLGRSLSGVDLNSTEFLMDPHSGESL